MDSGVWIVVVCRSQVHECALDLYVQSEEDNVMR